MEQMQMQEQGEILQGVFDASFAPFILEIFGVTTLERKAVYAAFFEKYNNFVLHELGKRNKFTQNFEDLHARIWVDFTGSGQGQIGLIEKFFTQAAESAPELPATLTGEEVAKLLNITWDTWRVAWWKRNIGKPSQTSGVGRGSVYRTDESIPRKKSSLPEFPNPIEGSYQQPHAVYKTDDIEAWFEAFDQMRHTLPKPRDPKAWTFQLPKPRATKKHFVNYLKRCIANRFANFCRYEKRRHQERVWDTFADQRSQLEDPAPWEDRQEVPSSQEEEAELALLIARLEKSPAKAHVRTIILAIYDDGYSLRDAIGKVVDMTPEQKRLTIRDVCDRRMPLHAMAIAAA